jgi:predicted HicB family RNase H-like nuclease
MLGQMPGTIEIRSVPAALHRRLKSRAASAGMSLSAYLLNELRDLAERSTVGQLRARLERLPPINPSVSPARAVRAERDRR